MKEEGTTSTFGGHRSLIAWQKAVELVVDIYKATREFPREELYGLVSQLRRAAVSVASNIAEGYGRNSKNELRHFLGQSRGSLAELETQIEIAGRLGYFANNAGHQLLGRVGELGRIISGLRSWSAGN